MTWAAHQMAVKRIAAFVWLVRQLHSTLLAYVAINMKIFIHWHDSNCFLGSLDRSDSYGLSVLIPNIFSSWFVKQLTFSTTCAFWRKHTVIIVYAIYLVVSVHGEWNSVQTLVANAAAEASRMIWLAHCLQNLKQCFLFYNAKQNSVFE